QYRCPISAATSAGPIAQRQRCAARIRRRRARNRGQPASTAAQEARSKMRHPIVSLAAFTLALGAPLAILSPGAPQGTDLCGKTIDQLLLAHGAPTSVECAIGGLRFAYTEGPRPAFVSSHGDVVIHVEGADALPAASGKLPALYLGMRVADAMTGLG